MERIAFVIGLFGLMITILSCFIEVDGSNKIHLTAFKCILLILFLLVLCISVTFLFFKRASDDRSTPKTNDSANSSIEQLIADHYDKIIQKTSDYTVLANGAVSFRCIESGDPVSHDSFDSIYYGVWTNKYGIVSEAGETYYYFEINKRYELDVQPDLMEKSTNVIPYFYDSDYQTTSEVPDNTNILDFNFDYDGNKFTPYKL